MMKHIEWILTPNPEVEYKPKNYVIQNHRRLKARTLVIGNITLKSAAFVQVGNGLSTVLCCIYYTKSPQGPDIEENNVHR